MLLQLFCRKCASYLLTIIAISSICLGIVNASDCATGTSSQTTPSGNSCRVQKDALEKPNNPSESSGSETTGTHQSKASK